MKKALNSCQELICKVPAKTEKLPFFEGLLDFSYLEEESEQMSLQGNQINLERQEIRKKHKEILAEVRVALQKRFLLLQETLGKYEQAEKSFVLSVDRIAEHKFFHEILIANNNLRNLYQTLKDLRLQIGTLVMNFPQIKQLKARRNNLEMIVSQHKKYLKLEPEYLSQFEESARDHLYAMAQYFEEVKERETKIFGNYSGALYKAYKETLRIAFKPEQNYRVTLNSLGIRLLDDQEETQEKEESFIVVQTREVKGVRGAISRGLLRRRGFSSSLSRPVTREKSTLVRPMMEVSDYLDIMRDPLLWKVYFEENGVNKGLDQFKVFKIMLSRMAKHQDGKSDAECQKALLNITKLIFHCSKIYEKPTTARKIYNTYSVFAREKKCLAEFAHSLIKILKDTRVF